MSEASTYADSVLVACHDGIDELSDSGGDPHTIQSVNSLDGIIRVDFTDGSALIGRFEVEETGLREPEND